VSSILPTATEADEEARGAEHVILPVGSFEQHGTYLPLITDTAVACAVSLELVGTYSLFMLPPVTHARTTRGRRSPLPSLVCNAGTCERDRSCTTCTKGSLRPSGSPLFREAIREPSESAKPYAKR